MRSSSGAVLSSAVVHPPESVRRHFLPWDRPLLPQAVEFLAENWAGEGPLDLSRRLVVVPTRQAGRRLREALAAHAARFGAAVFPPRVMVPELLVAAAPEKQDLATRLESLLAWTEVFREVDLEAFRAVFPVDPPARDFAWAFRLAQQFARLRRALAEGGLQLTEVAERTGPEFPEFERWQQIGELASRHAEKLGAVGLRDAQAAEIAAATAPARLEGIERMVLMGTPDPLPLALTVLASHARELPVDVLVFAPEADAAAFDGWGRPRADVWTARELVLPEFERRVHLCLDAADQANRVVAIARSYDEPEGVLGIGVADTEIHPRLESGLGHAGIAVFNPEGRRRKGDALYQLLSALSGLGRDPSFAAVATLARCPDFLEFLGGRIRSFSAARLLAELDELQARHLPPTLAEARRQAESRNAAGSPERAERGRVLTEALRVIDEVRGVMQAASFPEGVAAALGLIFGGRAFDLARPTDERSAEAASAWVEVMREVASAAEKFGSLSSNDGWDLALRLYGEELHYDEKAPGAVELQGWLELLWEDAPHLVVAGMNDGRVPDAVVGDPFLPEKLRERLGLKTNAARFARDAYLLQALAACRSKGGARLDLFLGKTTSAGDPLRPSRLLLRCADAELPRRVQFLFRGVDASRAMPGWRRAWRLAPRREPPPARIAVTAFRAWLECPFRFYLSRVLRMEEVDPAKNELDAMDFGTLCHAALEAMGREPGLRDCMEPAVLREFLIERVEAEATRRYGAQLTLPLVVQLEAARQRLGRVAEVQAQTRAEGWVIDEVERPFELDVGGLVVSGKIDRIDRHERTGEWRVIDYKTSDRPVEPSQAHLRNARNADETAAEFARVTFNARELVWTDLQLPLYLRAVAADASRSSPLRATCGYFNLPKASTETSICHWDDYTRELDESAWRCALGVAAAVQEGVFWPPNEKVRPERDRFASLFHHGVAESVVWEEES